jgi:hypothetical protein
MRCPHYISFVYIHKSVGRIKRHRKYFETWTYAQISKKGILYKGLETCHIKEINICTLLKIIIDYSETNWTHPTTFSIDSYIKFRLNLSSGFEDEHSTSHTNFWSRLSPNAKFVCTARLFSFRSSAFRRWVRRSSRQVGLSRTVASLFPCLQDSLSESPIVNDYLAGSSSQYLEAPAGVLESPHSLTPAMCISRPTPSSPSVTSHFPDEPYLKITEA